MAKNKLTLLGLAAIVVLVGSLPMLIQAIKITQLRLGKAAGKPASLQIDSTTELGLIKPIWQNFAQGGEEKYPLTEIISEVKYLTPGYIRIDHVYDFYEVVTKVNGQVRCNWSQLDQVVGEITQTGAVPFLALSYMPSELAKNGVITNKPIDWNDWQELVRLTVDHYSGKNNMNLTNVYYEVWNEPDLFGEWKIDQEPSYLQLYGAAAKGAKQAENVNKYYLGGPATTALYKNWVEKLVNFTRDNQLPLDFISWHRYSAAPEQYLVDVNQLDTWLYRLGRTDVQKVISEWGPDSNNSGWYDNQVSAAHLVASVRQVLNRSDLMFAFELKDGQDPNKKKYWGRWGLLTYGAKIASTAAEIKPRYNAVVLLNNIRGSRLAVEGEGSWVSSIAAKQGDIIQIILANYDPENKHYEVVPVKIKNLTAGKYSYKEYNLRGLAEKKEVEISDTLTTNIALEPNGVSLIILDKPVNASGSGVSQPGLRE